MREIGGYLELERFGGEEYHSDALAFNTATNALLWLVAQRGIRRIWMPDYLCGSVTAALERVESCEIVRYPVREDLTAELPLEAIDSQDAVYLVNYYGQLSMESVRQLRGKLHSLILDNVQAFFEKPLPGVDTVYSCRKWFGVPDGAYLYADGLKSRGLPQEYAADRFSHLLGRFEGEASDWYAAYQKNETELEHSPIRLMSPLTHNLLRAVDYSEVAYRRSRNFSFLDGCLKEVNKLHLTVPNGAFMYPLFLQKGDPQEIRQKMAKKRIYLPILWPGLSGRAERISNQILPLPVDQRYDERDLERMISCLREMI